MRTVNTVWVIINKDMTMRLRIIILMCLCSLMPLSAQEGLHVAKVFEGKVAETTKETIQTGEALRKYGLTKLRTWKTTVPDSLRNKIEALVNQDYEERDRREEEVDREVRDGHIYYCIFRLGSRRTELSIGGDTSFKVWRQYLCYQCKTNPGQRSLYDITLVFLEGENLTLDKLKKNFKRK